MSGDLHTLGRERIPGRPGEGGRTVVSAIGEESYGLSCPRCAARELLDVDDHGTAECRSCGLMIPRLLPPLEEGPS